VHEDNRHIAGQIAMEIISRLLGNELRLQFGDISVDFEKSARGTKFGVTTPNRSLFWRTSAHDTERRADDENA
jgi:hypothetical protein